MPGDPIGAGARQVQRPDDCLAGGGKMGAIVRAFDWSTTSLGPVETWPQSLRTAVSIMLASGFPMLILWGPDYIQLYNDAFRPVLGSTKHPGALGQRGRECWPEIWKNALEPMFGQVMSGGEAIWSENAAFYLDRNSYLEETFFTFSYSAIREESGKPGGVLATCVETTERVLAERRLQTLRELAAHASGSPSVDAVCERAASILARNPHDVPFALLYLLDGDRRARLVSSAGLEQGHPAAPAVVEWREDIPEDIEKRTWPLASVAGSTTPEVVTDLAARFGRCPGGPWPEPAEAAAIIPIAHSERAALGVLVAGINPRRVYDSTYRTFLELAASQVAIALINARAYEAERERAEALALIDRAKTTFFSNVSHEFRTPLGTIESEIRGLEAAGRVLIADDNADMRRYLANTLSSRWTVETVADGAAALAAIRKRKPHVLLTDIMLPGLDGYQLLRALRADPAIQDVRVVMLSGRAGEEAHVEGFDAGADDYLTKPFNARELIARVNAQLTIAKAHARLSEQRNELYSLFMQAPAPICVMQGLDLRFEMANDLYLKVAGRSDVVGKTFFEVFPGAGGREFDELILEVMHTKKPVVAHEVPVRLDRGRGVEDAWFAFIYAPLANAAGATDRVMCFCNEVTEQAIARREAERASRAKNDFLAMLGHELRNPIAPIVAALHLMKEKEEDTFGMERVIIERQVEYMVRLVDDLIDVGRIARGQVELKKRPIEFAEIIFEALDSANPLIEERSQRVTIDVPETGLMIAADEVRFAQVVANLLTNASKFTPAGGHVSVSAAAENGNAVLRVKDTGKGISADLLPRIFDLFVQGERFPELSRAGLGLGLSIVKSFTELHGGRVTARSEGEEKGSEFTISVPLLKRESTP